MLMLAIGSGVAWLYAPTAGFDFVMFDDDINLYQNPHLGDLTPERIRWAFADRDYMHRFMPLGWLAWCGILSARGLDPSAYHVANLVLHAVNAVLVAALVFQLLRLRQRRSGRECDPGPSAVLAGLAALLWAVHPLRVEVVAWSSGLLYLQATAWALVSGLCFIAAVQSCGRRNLLLQGATIVTFALSVATYPVALGWPFVFLALKLLPSARAKSAAGGAGWVTPVVTFAVAILGVLAAVGARVAVTSYWSAPQGLTEFPLGERITRASFALLHHVWGHLSFGPLTPVTEFFQVGSAGRLWLWPSVAIVAVGATALVCVARHERWRGTVLWSLAFVGVSAPFLGVLDRSFEPADRYTYVPGVVLVAGLAALLQTIRWRATPIFGGCGEHGRTAVWARWIAVAAAVSLGGAVPWLASRTREQLSVWRHSDALFAHVVAQLRHDPARGIYLARHAVYRTRQGDDRGAAALMRQAETLVRGPGDLNFYRDLNERLRTRSAAASDRPVPPAAVESLSLALHAARTGNKAGADAHFGRTLRLAPTYFEARYDYALWLAREGRTGEAEQHRKLLAAAHGAFTPELQDRLDALLRPAPARTGG